MIAVVQLLGLEVKAPQGFDLDACIRSGEFGYRESSRTVLLKAVFDAYTAKHLAESPVAKDQTLKSVEDGRVMLTARVLDTSELRWWLRAFGPGVEVLAKVYR